MPFSHHHFLGLGTLKSKEENKEKGHQDEEENKINHPLDA
jgi:hypothetical protein